MRTVETTVYTAQELKDKFPSAFDKALAQYAENFDWPWQGEEFDSLKATIEAYGATLEDWDLSSKAYRSSIRVSVDDNQDYPDDWDEETQGEWEYPAKDAEWALREVLTPLGYVKDGNADFPGHCKFTGYCADDDFMEAVYRNLQSGDTLTEALEDLARVYAKRAEDEYEYQTSEECFLEMADANGWEYEEDGTTA